VAVEPISAALLIASNWYSEVSVRNSPPPLSLSFTTTANDFDLDFGVQVLAFLVGWLPCRGVEVTTGGD
jgi:hypothetical protein